VLVNFAMKYNEIVAKSVSVQSSRTWRVTSTWYGITAINAAANRPTRRSKSSRPVA
jgi:hypothetical protein